MFSRFTASSRRVMQRAFNEAKRWRHDFVGTEHLLFGLLRDVDGPINALLNSLHARPSLMLDKVEVALQQHAEGIDQERFPLSPALRRVFESAEAEAAAFNHRLLSPEHLLLGLMRESECAAAQILRANGVTLQALHAAVAQLPADAMPEAQVKAGVAKRGSVPAWMTADDLEDQVMPIRTVELAAPPSPFFATAAEVSAHLRRTQFAFGGLLGFMVGLWAHDWKIGALLAWLALMFVYAQRFWLNILFWALAPAIAIIISSNWRTDHIIYVPLLILLGAFVGSLLGPVWISDRTSAQTGQHHVDADEDAHSHD